MTRTKTMQLTAVGPELYRLCAWLNDISLHGDYGADDSDGSSCSHVIHDFVLEAQLEGPQLVIAELDVQAHAHPYRQCPAVLASCQALVGMSLTSRWRGTVLEMLGATAGCTHVTTLLLGLAEARTMVFFLQMNEREPYSEQTRSDGRWTAAGLDVAPSIVDACHALHSSGPVIDEARKVAEGHPSAGRIRHGSVSDEILHRGEEPLSG
ncbi:DUF2889 domain-containing protein [Mycobacterium sp.]|uniref:DUF2889 domain-containing protein n=1 Tax=Mycobacterium sp. TaxID=1785 RepID=UPI003D0FC301